MLLFRSLAWNHIWKVVLFTHLGSVGSDATKNHLDQIGFRVIGPSLTGFGFRGSTHLARLAVGGVLKYANMYLLYMTIYKPNYEQSWSQDSRLGVGGHPNVSLVSEKKYSFVFGKFLSARDFSKSK